MVPDAYQIRRLLTVFLAEELAKLGETEPSDDDERPWPPAAVVARLARYHWPGNVRELRNVARRLAIDGRGSNPDHLLQSIEDLLVEPPPVPEPPVSASAVATVGRRPSDIRGRS